MNELRAWIVLDKDKPILTDHRIHVFWKRKCAKEYIKSKKWGSELNIKPIFLTEIKQDSK